MTKLYNKKELTQRRKELRKSQTEEERILWSRLRNKQLIGLKFRRQFSIGNYILDFYCPKLKLGIEVDGSHHFKPEVMEYDARRTQFLEAVGVKIIRFTNREVRENLDGVLQKIVSTSPPPINRRHPSL